MDDFLTKLQDIPLGINGRNGRYFIIIRRRNIL